MLTHHIAIIRNRLDMADLFSPFSRHITHPSFHLRLDFFSERELWLYVVVRPSVCLSVCNVRAPYSGD